jgi:tRNA dimethylallyltransferase
MNERLKKTSAQLREDRYVIPVIGTTASGKSTLGVRLAKVLGGEVISLDSMQIYRGMDIGTGKLSKQEMEGIEHYMIDLVSPSKNFSAGEFASMADEKIDEIRERGNLPIVVGGTGLYLKALLQGLFKTPARSEIIRKNLSQWEKKEGLQALYKYLLTVDAKARRTVKPADRQRIYRAIEIFLVTGIPQSLMAEKDGFGEERYRTIKIGLTFTNRADLYRAIDKRVDCMLDAGWIDEVRLLLKKYSPELHPFKALGYREIVKHLQGEIEIEEMKNEIKKVTRNFAKRQLTWFKRIEGIQWFNSGDGIELVSEQVLQYIGQYYE